MDQPLRKRLLDQIKKHQKLLLAVLLFPEVIFVIALLVGLMLFGWIFVALASGSWSAIAWGIFEIGLVVGLAFAVWRRRRMRRSSG